MGAPSLPAAFEFLADESNPAADAALVEALPTLEPAAQAAALNLLAARDNVSALVTVVGQFPGYDQTLQQRVMEHVTHLVSAVRTAITSSERAHRAGAIELILRSRAVGQAYLLADALREDCPRTRELAADALHRLTRDVIDRMDQTAPGAALGELHAQADTLAESLCAAVRRFELHRQPKVVEAAVWLADRTESTILQSVRKARSRIGRVLMDQIASTTDPRKAGFVLRALAVPELRGSAAAAISRSERADFIEALIAQSWLLADTQIERGCRRIRDLSFGAWMECIVGVVEPTATAGAIGILAASGGSQTTKEGQLRELLGMGREDLQQSVVWRLIHDRSALSSEVLSVMAARPGTPASSMAARELRRRSSESAAPLRPGGCGEDAADYRLYEDIFEQYWLQFDEREDGELAVLEATIVNSAGDLPLLLRQRMASGSALDRGRALRMASRFDLVREVEESVYRLASDPDPIVRSIAIGLLAKLPGASSERLLKIAVNDTDERVQANAVEALDRLNVADRVRCTQPKLDSSNSRLKANAVRSLLRAELRQAGDALLNMVESDASSERMAALWVIEQLRLRSVLHRVVHLSRHDLDERVRERAKTVARVLASGAVVNDAATPSTSNRDTSAASTGDEL